MKEKKKKNNKENWEQGGGEGDRNNEVKKQDKKKANHHQRQQQQKQKLKKNVALHLCSINVGAGTLPPDNDTLQLHDCGGGGDDDDDEVENGDNGHNDDVLQHVKDLWVVQIELCGHQVVQSGVGHWMDR